MNFVLYTDNSTIVFSGRTAASFYFLHTPPFCGNQHIIDFSNFLAFKTPFLLYFVPSIIIIIERRLAFQNHISCMSEKPRWSLVDDQTPTRYAS